MGGIECLYFIVTFVLGGPRSEAKLWNLDNRSPTLIKHKQFSTKHLFKVQDFMMFLLFLVVCPKVSGAHSIVQEFE